jgi:hypothetical protein
MNTNASIIERKESKKMLVKEWARINSSSNNENNNLSFSPIVYKTDQTGRGISFSIGDSWIERIEKKVHSYKVVASEDIIIPAGVYKCYKVIEEVEDGIKNYYWFAPAIGLIKWEIGNIKGILQACLQNDDKEA